MAPCVLIRDLYSGIIILDASLYFRNLHRKLHHLIPIYPPIVKKFVDLYDPKNMTSAPLHWKPVGQENICFAMSTLLVGLAPIFFLKMQKVKYRLTLMNRVDIASVNMIFHSDLNTKCGQTS
jgi:hypothetical protein